MSSFSMVEDNTKTTATYLDSILGEHNGVTETEDSRGIAALLA